jgi:hypothetical protein
MTGNLVYLISTKGARRMWPVIRGCLLLLGTWSYLCICRRSVLPYTRFCNCRFGYDYVLHIVNFAILYYLLQMEQSMQLLTFVASHLRKCGHIQVVLKTRIELTFTQKCIHCIKWKKCQLKKKSGIKLQLNVSRKWI